MPPQHIINAIHKITERNKVNRDFHCRHNNNHFGVLRAPFEVAPTKATIIIFPSFLLLLFFHFSFHLLLGTYSVATPRNQWKLNGKMAKRHLYLYMYILAINNTQKNSYSKCTNFKRATFEKSHFQIFKNRQNAIVFGDVPTVYHVKCVQCPAIKQNLP